MNPSLRLWMVWSVFLGLVLAGCRAKTQPEWEFYTPQVFDRAIHSHQPILMEFSTSNCAPCTRLQKNYLDPDLKKVLGHFKKIRVDATLSRAPEIIDLKQTYHIKGFPTLIFFDSRGVEIGELQRRGYVSSEGLLEYLLKYKSRLFVGQVVPADLT